jgi:phage shock protein A
MTEDTLNIEEIKMHNKTVSKILVAIIMTSMLLAIIPTLPVAATTISSLTPSTGNVGATVRLVGSIDTEGGAYTIWFDVDDDGTAVGDTSVKTGSAPTNSLLVNTTFTVPACVGTDGGNGHKVTLRDLSSGGTSDATFTVQTKRAITVAAHDQEGDVVSITMTVTGGIATTLNNFTLTVTDPAGTATMNYNVSFSTNALGSGNNVTSFPTDFTTGASSNFTGTYTIVADRKLPGVIANAATKTFTIGLTDKTSYGRFETVNVKTSGWTPYQNVSITITDPSATVVKSWTSQNLTTGVFTGTWVIPWNASLGTYTITAVNATGNNKAIASTQTFTVTSAAMTVVQALAPASSYQRTNTAKANFTISYPDATYLNTSQFSSITVSVYYNTTLVTTIPLTTANFNPGDNSWQVTWKIPRNASLGIGYKFSITKNSITDTTGNTGPTSTASSSTFTITAAVLTVNIKTQPAANYTRTQAAKAVLNITYPDKTYFTNADLGSIKVGVFRGATSVANLTLAASAFNATTNRWTISWVSGYNETLATNYVFTIAVSGVKDVAVNTNTAAATTTAFELLKAKLNIASVNTDKTSYARGEFVRIYFDATYADGSPVTTGTSAVTLTAPDGFTTTTVNPVHTSAGRWQVTWWLSESQQTGSWNITLTANAVVDGATASSTANTGPVTTLRKSFTVLPATATLDSILAAIEDLDDRLDDVEADTNALGSGQASLSTKVTNLQTTVGTLQSDLDDLQAALDSLSATTATTTEVAAVSTALTGVSTDLAALESSLSALSTAVDAAASESDVAAVNAAVDELSADLAALESSLSDLSTAVDAAATPADVDSAVDAAVSDLSGDIGGINTLVIVAVVLALIAAIAAILAVYIIQRKIAG